MELWCTTERQDCVDGTKTIFELKPIYAESVEEARRLVAEKAAKEEGTQAHRPVLVEDFPTTRA
jgi:hypothetical protein